MTTNLMRRKERCGSSSAAASAVLMEGELGVLTDVKKLIVGDDSKAGGYQLTPDNVVAIWPDQASAASPLSIAWWINRANGAAVKLRLPAGTYNVLNDLTIPANIYLEIDHGAVFSVASGKTLTLNCEIGVDVQPLFSGSGTVVENYVRRLHINENLLSHSVHLWHNGKRSEATGAVQDDYGIRHYVIHSDLFEIEPAVVYTLKAFAACRASFVFFNEEKEFLSSLWSVNPAAGFTFTTPAQAAFVGVNSYLRKPDNSGYYKTSKREVGWKHLYKLEKGAIATAFSIAPRDLQDPPHVEPNDPPKNNPEAARQLVSCAESYLGATVWVYGNQFHSDDPNTAEGPPQSSLFETVGGITKARIDCVTLIRLALNGIPYFHSKYFNADFPWRGADYYSWAKYPKWNYFSDFCFWCYENGWSVDPGINYNNLQAGDIIFWGGNPRKETEIEGFYEGFVVGGFRSIDHVAMYTGRWVPDPNRNNELHPQTVEVGQTGDIVKHNFVDRVSDGTTLTSCSVEYIQMIARLPLESPYTEFDSKRSQRNVIYSSYYKPSVSVVGNGQPLKIDIYGRNGALWEIGSIDATNGGDVISPKYIRSKNYTPANYNYKNQAALNAAGFVAVNRHFYDSELQFMPPAQTEGRMYDRYVFKKSDGTNITAADMATFNTLTALQKEGRNTKKNGVYPAGFHSCAHLETVIPNGARLDRHNGKYAYTTDGVTWTELPETDQAKLVALRIGDGENNIYVPNGQHVMLMRQAMGEPFDGRGTGTYIAFGDSIVYGWTSAPEQPRRTNYPYVEAIGRAAGLTAVNKAVNGQGLFKTGSTDPKVAYETLVENMSLIRKADLVTLSWGKNDILYPLGTSTDASSAETICGRWKKCIEYIRLLKASAQIIVVAPIKRADKAWSDVLGSGGWSLDDFEAQISAVAASYNIPFVTWRKCGIVNNIAAHAADNLHPDTYMYKRMAAYIAGQVSQYFLNVWDL